jgi:hypothetical protein
MKLPRFRLTVRRMMIAVAVVAIAIPTYSWLLEVARKAESYRNMARYYRTVITSPGATPEYLERFASWRSAMIRKYDRAVLSPWLPIEPDTDMPRR